MTVESPQAGLSQALVQVEAISLNRGEVRDAMEAEAGWRPGWDLAGTVIKQARMAQGRRLGVELWVRFPLPFNGGAWAEQVAVPTNMLAEIPTNVMFAQAATLPIAGLTALYAA